MVRASSALGESCFSCCAHPKAMVWSASKSRHMQLTVPAECCKRRHAQCVQVVVHARWTYAGDYYRFCLDADGFGLDHAMLSSGVDMSRRALALAVTTQVSSS